MLTSSFCNLNGGEGPTPGSVELAGTVLKCSQVFSHAGIDNCLPATAPVLQPAKEPAKAGHILLQAASLEHLGATTRVLQGCKLS